MDLLLRIIESLKPQPLISPKPDDNLIKAINIIREQNKLVPLKTSPSLETTAMRKAQDMVEKGYWAHKDPKGKQAWDMMTTQKYNYAHAGENLAKNYSNDKETVDAWMNSKTHKENILNPNYTEAGIGRSKNITANHFASPKSKILSILGL